MKVIYKQNLEMCQGMIELEIEPKNIMSFQLQDDNLCVWYIQDLEIKEKKKRHYILCFTGSKIDMYIIPIGTVQDKKGLVWHLLYAPSAEESLMSAISFF